MENTAHAIPLMTDVDYNENEDSSIDYEDSDDDISMTDLCESLSSDSCSDLDIIY